MRLVDLMRDGRRTFSVHVWFLPGGVDRAVVAHEITVMRPVQCPKQHDLVLIGHLILDREPILSER